MQAKLTECVLARWQPGFNDPYLLSWIMVAIYLLVAAIAIAAVRRGAFPATTARRERVFWGVVAGALVFMAVNKQADLQTLLLASGRCLSQAQGWFESRRLVQKIAMIVLGLAALGGGAVILWRLRRTLRRTALPLVGLFLMAGFLLVRAAGMFHVEGWLVDALAGRWPSRLLELSGPLAILIGALVVLRRGKRRRGRAVARPRYGRQAHLLAPPSRPGQSCAMSPRPTHVPRAGAAIIGLIVLNAGLEFALAAADSGLIGSPRWRAIAYQNGAFWAGLLHSWEPNYAAQPWLMFLSYSVLHGGIVHLAGNMLVLWGLGRVLRLRLATAGFLAVYFLSAAGAGLCFGLLSHSPQPMVGASGALFGLVGTWQYWHWSRRRRTGRSLRPVWQALAWLASLNVVFWVLLGGLLAWQAHLGGFVTGWIVAAAIEWHRGGRRARL